MQAEAQSKPVDIKQPAKPNTPEMLPKIGFTSSSTNLKGAAGNLQKIERPISSLNSSPNENLRNNSFLKQLISGNKKTPQSSPKLPSPDNHTPQSNKSTPKEQFSKAGQTSINIGPNSGSFNASNNSTTSHQYQQLLLVPNKLEKKDSMSGIVSPNASNFKPK